MKTPPMKSPLDGDVTIDHSTVPNDNGYLGNARDNNPGFREHENVQVMTANLVDRKPFNAIIGHGDVGVVFAGSGMQRVAANQLLDIHNVGTVGFNNLGTATEVVLYSCHTGAGVRGAQLLFQIAKQVNAPVWAPTGFIFLTDNGRFRLQRKAKWQKALPSASDPPTAIDAAPPPQGPLALPFGGLKSIWTGRRWDRVTKVTYDDKRRRNLPLADQLPEDPPSISLSDADAQRVVRTLRLARPYRIRGIPGAQHTGDLAFEFKDGLKCTFRVFSNRVIQDLENQLFYFTSGTVSTGFGLSPQEDE